MPGQWEYVCPKCANAVAAERVERRVPGSKGMVRVMPPVDCEKCNVEMMPEKVVPVPREVSAR